MQQIDAGDYSFKDLLAMDNEELERLFSTPDQTALVRYEDLEKMFPYIDKELKRTGVNRWILWAEYKQKHPDGYSYPHFCAYLRQWRNTKSATMHFEHAPADKMFIDFARNFTGLITTPGK